MARYCTIIGVPPEAGADDAADAALEDVASGPPFAMAPVYHGRVGSSQNGGRRSRFHDLMICFKPIKLAA
jgi:hypothetical protein